MVASIKMDKKRKKAFLRRKRKAMLLKKLKKRKELLKNDLLKQDNNNPNDNSLAQYLKDIDKIKLLTREQEVDLATRMAAGDERAKQKLVQSNLRFVVNVSKKYQNRGLPLSDLISEGNLGLLKAAEKFDYTRGYHFISYAVWWIKQSILKALSEKSRMIRLPLNRANQLIQIEKLIKEKKLEDKEDLSVEEIAKHLNISEENVNDIMRAAGGHVSMEKPLANDKRERSLLHLLKSESIPTPDANAIHKSIQETISKVLDTLDYKESEVIKYRYGLNDYNVLSLQQIGEKFSLTKERIRQIEKKAIHKIQNTSRKDLLRPFLQNN